MFGHWGGSRLALGVQELRSPPAWSLRAARVPVLVDSLGSSCCPGQDGISSAAAIASPCQHNQCGLSVLFQSSSVQVQPFKVLSGLGAWVCRAPVASPSTALAFLLPSPPWKQICSTVKWALGSSLSLDPIHAQESLVLVLLKSQW